MFYDNLYFYTTNYILKRCIYIINFKFSSLILVPCRKEKEISYACCELHKLRTTEFQSCRSVELNASGQTTYERHGSPLTDISAQSYSLMKNNLPWKADSRLSCQKSLVFYTTRRCSQDPASLKHIIGQINPIHNFIFSFLCHLRLAIPMFSCL
jgi:hypothetical protein